MDRKELLNKLKKEYNKKQGLDENGFKKDENVVQPKTRKVGKQKLFYLSTSAIIKLERMSKQSDMNYSRFVDNLIELAWANYNEEDE